MLQILDADAKCHPFVEDYVVATARENVTEICRRWFVARTQGGRETLACEQLRNQRFDAYLPRIKRTVRHAQGFQTRMSPLFPGYVFVGFDAEHEPWRPVNGTIGVISLIMTGQRPSSIQTGMVEALMGTYPEHGASDSVKPAFMVGDTVQFTNGPFAKLVGRLQEVDGDRRVKVLLDLLGRDTPVWTTVEGALESS